LQFSSKGDQRYMYKCMIRITLKLFYEYFCVDWGQKNNKLTKPVSGGVSFSFRKKDETASFTGA